MNRVLSDSKTRLILLSVKDKYQLEAPPQEWCRAALVETGQVLARTSLSTLTLE